ncbi:MAG: ABC transporter ATP-binding protein, partial [Thaumarchaeota archaeon]|nr:ABC transporter ATP-binding protein [Nitrososphaerota archaeon]
DIDIYSMGEAAFDKNIRWKRIATVPQAAMNVFDPVYTIEEQIIETIRVHTPFVSKEKARDTTRQLLELVGIESARAGSYPHQLSGGMKQRAAIALALCLSPNVLIADEPTTALDVIVQAQILALLMEIRKKFGMTLILISHDLALVAQYCSRIAIMYAGSRRFADAQSVATVPNLLDERRALKSIPGTLPSQFRLSNCCGFEPRCQFAVSRCSSEDPPLFAVGASRNSACFEWKRLEVT